MTCIHCGRQLTPTMRFCDGCGRPIVTARVTEHLERTAATGPTERLAGAPLAPPVCAFERRKTEQAHHLARLRDLTATWGVAGAAQCAHMWTEMRTCRLCGAIRRED
jgi:hypothetical protein